jgi:TRAP-type mannitol/chloroaromatic compound transport system substrate-binding protein
MQKKVIDAFESNTFYVDYGRGHHEVAKYNYISPSRAPHTGLEIVVNKAKWAELSPDLQQIVDSTFRDQWQPLVATNVALEGEYIQKWKDYGCIVEPLPAAVEAAYIAEAVKFYAEMRAADPEYDKILASMFAFKKLCDDQGIR